MVLVKDGGNLLTILPDGQEGLLVVMGGNVELEEVGSTSGAGEDSSVNVKTTTNVGVGALEGQVLLTATIIGLGSVSIEANSKSLRGKSLEISILLQHFGLQVTDVINSVIILAIRPGLEISNGLLSVRNLLVESVTQSLVLSGPGSILRVQSGVKGSNVSLPAIILSPGKVLKVGNASLASLILRLPGRVLTFGPVIKSLDFTLSGVVFSVNLAIKLGNICDPGLV